jgi:hypothetical protein
MRRVRLFNAALLVVLVLFIIGLSGYWRESKVVSMMQIVANPWFYHSKKITTLGFLNLDVERHLLYLHREDYQNSLPNAIWLGLDKQKLAENKMLDMHYVLIEGTFDALDSGRLITGAGSIKNVTRLEKIRNIVQPSRQVIDRDKF